MNIRSVADEGATRYLDSVDPYQPHSQNVQDHLRPLVLNWTKRILLDEIVSLKEASILQSAGSENLAYVESSDAETTEDAVDDDGDDDEKKQPGEVESETTGISKRSIARMEAFLKNCTLAISTEPLSHKSLSTSIHTGGPNQQKPYYPQFLHPDIAIRLEIYFRALKRVRDYNYDQFQDQQPGSKSYAFNLENKYECLIALEPQRVIEARVDALVRSFVETASNVTSIRPLLTALVLGLSLEVLAVDVLGKEVKQKINRLVSEYEHLTSFASLTFLSSPKEAADTHLSSLLLSYLQYLQSTYKTHENSSEVESLLANVLPADLRNTFHTVEFQSVGHLLQVCDLYAPVLQDIRLPPIRDYQALMAKCTNPKDVKQALKDLRREIITVNGNVIPPAHSLKELVRLLAETMNARTTYLYNEAEGNPTGRKVAANLVRIESDTSDDDQGQKDGSTSGNEGDSEGYGRHRARVRSNSRGGARKRSFDGATVDKMTARLLIAAGRSGTGADAYFVIQDLFGGEGVIVVPSRSQPKKASTKQQRSRKKVQVGTIDIVVRLASVTIKVHAHYDVYPEKTIGDEGCEPLIQLHSTTTETIHLHEVRVRQPDADLDGVKDDGDVKDPMADLNQKMESSMLMLREKKTADTGRRILSVKPASYKKVEVFNTPS